MSRLVQNFPTWLGAGGFGGSVVLVAGMAINPLAALALPFALLAMLLLFAQPFLGVFALAVFSHLDAVEKLLFGFLPVSSFKLIAMGTAVTLAIRGAELRRHLWALLKEPIVVCAGIFILLGFVSSLFADNRGAALDAMKDLMSFQLLLILVVVLANTRKRVMVLVYALAATSFFSALLLIADVATGLSLVAQSEAATTARTSEGFDRSSGGSNYNPTTAASMLLTGVIFALVHTLETSKWRLLLAAVVAFGTLAVVLSFARSAVVAYGLIVILLMWRYRAEKFVLFGLFCGLIAMLAALPFIPAEYWARLGTIVGMGSGGDWTLGRHMTYNIIGMDLIIKNPLLGVGPGNFPTHFIDPQYRYMPGRTMLGRELHNMYLSVAVQFGLGSIPFFAMIGYSFSRLRATARVPSDPQYRVMALALAYGFGAYLITSLFLPNEYTKYTWLLCALSAALFHQNKSEREAT